ncbi:Endoribonuclease L-PSP/chorismate mutase-like protein [Aspergillus desertorum]
MVTVRHISPPELHSPRGYTHIVTAEGAHRTIEIAGQVGLAPDGSLSEDYEGQVQQAFKNLQHCLKAAGSPTVTRLRYYIVGYKYPESLAAITAAKKLVIAEDEPLPTSVLVGVPALGHPALLFEVEATAVAKL